MEEKHPTTKRYPPELKLRAVKMVQELRAQDPWTRRSSPGWPASWGSGTNRSALGSSWPRWTPASRPGLTTHEEPHRTPPFSPPRRALEGTRRPRDRNLCMGVVVQREAAPLGTRRPDASRSKPTAVTSLSPMRHERTKPTSLRKLGSIQFSSVTVQPTFVPRTS